MYYLVYVPELITFEIMLTHTKVSFEPFESRPLSHESTNGFFFIFRKKEEPKVGLFIWQNKGWFLSTICLFLLAKTQINYLLMRKGNRGLCKDVRLSQVRILLPDINFWWWTWIERASRKKINFRLSKYEVAWPLPSLRKWERSWWRWELGGVLEMCIKWG